MTRPPSRLLAVAISLASCLLFPAIAFAGAVKPAETRPAARPAAPVPAVRPVALPTELALPGILSSDMVLQRGMPVPIWGVAAPDEKVTVTFRDQTKTAVADKDGKWSLKLDPLAPGEPATLTVAGKKRLTLTGVLVGDVWVGSGQSNMQMAVIGAAKGDKVLDALAAKDYPQIRLASATGHWREATAANNGKFSAILFSFGVPLQKELNVPIGLVVGAVGGTPSGRWLTREMFLADPDARKAAGWLPIDATPEEVELAENAHEATYQRALVNYKIDLAKWEAAHPAPPATAPASAPATAARPPAPAPAPAPKPVPDGKPLPPNRGGPAAATGDLYLANIAPMVPFAIRGVLWDQGESGTKVDRVDQFTLMGALIKGWRATWGQGDFPFIYVQKPSGGGCALDPASPVTDQSSKFAPLPAAVPLDGGNREVHIRIMQHPNTAMVIASDLGGGTHPTNKSGYGARAARVALGFAYGQKVEYYGPLYQGHKAEGGKIRVSFTHVGQGLTSAPGDKLQGFAIAGADRVYHWADAAIDGETVVLSSADVPHPVSVMYAYSTSIAWANLFNKDGLPAIPFKAEGK